MPIKTIERPELSFNMFRTGRGGISLATGMIRARFGPENYDEFKRAGKRGEYIPEEVRQQVDRKVYDEVGEMFRVRGGFIGRERFWKDAMVLAVRTHHYAREILFADQERQATLTTNIAWSDERPSSALERLTMPTRLIGEQCKYEQGLQLGMALLCAEIISRDENGNARKMLSKINDFLESKLFAGRKGDPGQHHVVSYHTPGTNKLVGLSSQYPDSEFEEGLWVKALDFPVRTIKNEGIPVLYDPREKEIESAVIKAMQRSLHTARAQGNGDIIETSPYAEDQLGFRLVVMQGDRSLRDLITSRVDDLIRTLDHFQGVENDDVVDSNHGSLNRVSFRRRKIYLTGLNSPIEMIIETLGDYISQLYDVGNYDPELGMHDGPAHDLYKLRMVSDVAAYLWPPKIFGINLEMTKLAASFEYATRLGRKQRIHPSPYS